MSGTSRGARQTRAGFPPWGAWLVRARVSTQGYLCGAVALLFAGATAGCGPSVLHAGAADAGADRAGDVTGRAGGSGSGGVGVGGRGAGGNGFGGENGAGGAPGVGGATGVGG